MYYLLNISAFFYPFSFFLSETENGSEAVQFNFENLIFSLARSFVQYYNSTKKYA